MKTRTVYKQTEIGEIPEEWEVKNIAELFDIVTGTTPSTKNNDYWKNGTVTWITPADMSKVNGKMYIQRSQRQITEKALREVNLTLMPKDSILLSTRAPVGYVAIITSPSTFNQGCKGLVPKNVKLVPEFFAYYLVNRRFFLESISSGSTFKELSKDALESIMLPYPELSEQQKIAEILSTVDDAIQKSDEIIKKTQLLKKGLLHHLLTRGIGHSRFKQTEIGEIPEEWEVVKLAEIAEFKNGINFTKELKGSRGVLTIDVLNMYGQSIYVDLSQLYRVNIDLKKEYFLIPGDILFVRSSLKREGVGWASLFGKWNEPVTYAGFIIRARLKRSDILPEFLTYFLRSGVARRELISSGGQVAITNISQDQLGFLDIPLPPLSEQQKIAEILSTVDKKIVCETERKEHLQKIKTGLMNDLLTGKRRVKVKA